MVLIISESKSLLAAASGMCALLVLYHILTQAAVELIIAQKRKEIRC